VPHAPPLHFCARPPRPRSTPRPYTTLFRSRERGGPLTVGEVTLRDPTTVPRDGAPECKTRCADPGAHRAPRRPDAPRRGSRHGRSEEHTSELQSRSDLVCRLLLEKKKEGHD